MKKISKILDIVVRLSIIYVAIINLVLGHYKFFILLPVMFLLTYYDYFAKYVLKLNLRDETKIFLTAFIFFAQVLAVNLDFYTLIPCWDVILHFLSGIMTYLIAEDIINTFKAKDKNFKINKAFLIIFCLLFSMASANLWEMVEFTIDGLFHTNTQKALGFAEREALRDSMEDIIAANGGALLMVLFNIFKKDKNDKKSK